MLARLLVAGCAAGESGQVLRRRLTVLGDDDIASWGAAVTDELGLSEELMARPVQAAVVSAVSFAVGAVLPLLAVVLAPAPVRILAVAGAALVVLGVLGGVGVPVGGQRLRLLGLR